MNCAEVQERECVERYLCGELEETELQELEEHYFACDDCFEALKDASALRSALAEERWVVPARQTPGRQPRTWPWLAAAAVVLVGIGIAIVPFLREKPDDATLEIARLAAIEAPPYTPNSLRGPGDEAERRFREAMVLYQASDYAGTIPGLEAAAELDSASARSAFYLGACYLLTDRSVPAVESFGRVVELGTSPYLESAHLYRGKAYLRVGDLDAARTELEKVVHSGGRFEGEARQILDQLPR